MVDHDWEGFASLLLLIEYTFVLSLSLQTLKRQIFSGDFKRYTHYFLFSLFVSLACLARILESFQLALGYNERVDYFLQLFASACTFSCFSTMSSLW